MTITFLREKEPKVLKLYVADLKVNDMVNALKRMNKSEAFTKKAILLKF